MYDLSGLNDAQRQAVTTTEGPLLIIAGPGTGKTHTLVQRAIYLIEEKKVAAERIMIVTFTEKAAKELITRITNETAKRGIAINLNEMYIGTFHSLCLRMLKDNVEYTDLGKNYTVIEDYALKYLLLGKVVDFEKEIAGFKEFFVGRKYSNYWKKAAEIVKIANKLEEEAVNLDALADDKDKYITCINVISTEKVFCGYSNGSIISMNLSFTKCFYCSKLHSNPIMNLVSINGGSKVISTAINDRTLNIINVNDMRERVTLISKISFDGCLLLLDNSLLVSKEGKISTVIIDNDKYTMKIEKRIVLYKEL